MKEYINSFRLEVLFVVLMVLWWVTPRLIIAVMSVSQWIIARYNPLIEDKPRGFAKVLRYLGLAVGALRERERSLPEDICRVKRQLGILLGETI